MPTWNPRANDLFLKAIERHSAHERRKFLDKECAGDAALRAEVEALVDASARAGRFLESPIPVPALPHTIDEPISERPGTSIGPYKLLEQIGEGGFGIVFMAEQHEPVRRKVALKVLKPGMDTRQVVARFEAERQALAIMDHPHIAKVFDGGISPSGRPYFVMELVKGTPISSYCDENHLTPRQRLELFIPVCQAVQHAHQKGIIHRDLKPSNVLVTMHDTTPVVKVIDFGVAKAVGQELTDKTLFTGFAQMIGTPLYMSPEQAGQSSLDIDTRSDIYSLGVLLYELLTGTTPFDRERFKKAAYDEIRRIIREEEPPKPSSRLSASKDSLPSVSALRQTEPKKLTRFVRGELDWIIMKCLEKDRNRRYETANGLASDIRRYLGDEPVTASPPSTLYRFRKFVRRNRVSVAAVAALTCFVLFAVVGLAIANVLITQERDQKDEALRDREAALALAEQEKQHAQASALAEKAAKETSQRREAETEAVLDFVEKKVFAAARPEGRDGGLGHEVKLRQAVEAALPFVANSFRDQPLIEARLRMTLGVSFDYLGESKSAAEQFEAARSIYLKNLGHDHPQTLLSISNLAGCYRELGRGAEALRLNEETLAIRRAQLGPNHRDTLASMSNLAGDYSALGRRIDACKLMEEVVALAKARYRSDDEEMIRYIYNLAGRYSDLGRYADSLRLEEEILPIVKAKFGPTDQRTLMVMSSLSATYSHLDRNDEALKLCEETLALEQSKLGPDHPSTLISMHNLAARYSHAGRYADAVKLLEETLALKKRKLGVDHPLTLGTMHALANDYVKVGRRDDARQLFEETIAAMQAKLGPDHPNTLGCMVDYGSNLLHNGRAADAAKTLQEALNHMKIKMPEHPFTFQCMSNLTNAYHGLGRYADAVKLLDEALAQKTALYGRDDKRTLHTMDELARYCYQLGRQDQALKLFEELLALQKAKVGADYTKTIQYQTTLGALYTDLGRRDEAARLQAEALQVLKDKLGADNPRRLQTMHDLALSHARFGRHEYAAMWNEKTLEERKAMLGPDDPNTLWTMNNLAINYYHLNRFAEATKLMEETLKQREVRLGPAHPDTVESMNAIAWWLSTVPELMFRNPPRAVELAIRATEAQPKVASYWGTLGTAQYQNREFQEAVAHLSKAIALRDTSDAANSADALFLAMAHWQLGEKDEAREWYAKAIAWLEKGRKDDAELQRFRSEAAQLLGEKKTECH